MKIILPQTRRFEFGFPYLDATVLVEDHGDSVDIRATRDTFTEARKLAFVHELAAEGFIDTAYLWFPLAGPDSPFGVRWHVDASWLELSPVLLARARRFMIAALAGAGLLEAVLLGGVWAFAGG